MGGSDRVDINGYIASRLTFGPTVAPYGITVLAGQNSILLKQVSGGTLEIVSGSSFAAGATLAGTGYPFGSNEILGLDSAGTVWVLASGATSILALVQGRSAGFETS